MYKDLVENACGNNIKVLRNENGKEYVNKSLQHPFEECGIQMKHSMPYTPDQNGVVECKNRALKEMDTCTMEAKDLNCKVWDKDINYVTYAQNRSPHK